MKVKYVGNQLNAETNIGRFERGQVSEVWETAEPDARRLIANGQFVEVDAGTPVGTSEEDQQRNREDRDRIAQEEADARARLLSGGTPLDPNADPAAQGQAVTPANADSQQAPTTKGTRRATEASTNTTAKT